MFNINGYQLDEDQINAITSNSKNKLIVAGAGSGKTLTILGYINYLIKYKKINEEEILAISFTNESTNSLNNKLLNMNINIDVLTFHKLGLKILGDKYKPIEDSYLKYIIEEFIKSYISNNTNRNRLFKNILHIDTNKNLYRTIEYKELIKLIITFINLLKSSNMDEHDIINFYNKTYFNEKELIKIILEIYLIYKRELESMNRIDFNDMISYAIDRVKDTNLTYKYIIIDEFQDTSPVRFDLIKEIIKYTNANLFVVGDDYQSIYRFSGCNLDIFININEYIDNTSIYYLNHTYRNSNELIYISSSFIMKNPKQLKKNIVSNKSIKKPIMILIGFKLEDILNKIDNPLVLGRNNKDIDDIEYNNKLTIHKSKGLEADNVILVNSDNIPNNNHNEKILRFVLDDKDYIIHEEERRLFYVALTRTRNKIYILVNKRMSPFVKELIHDYKSYVDIRIK